MTKSIKNEQRERQKKGVQARLEAIQSLIANHQAEFDALVVKNRVALGLPPRASGPTADALEERSRRLREQLAKVEADLRLAHG